MLIVLPFLYLLFGFILGKLKLDIKNQASVLLTNVIIPFVIIYNISTNFYNMSVIIIIAVIITLVMFAISRIFTNDPIKNITFCYYNLGWLGVPLSHAFFGETAALIALAAYIGNSIIGISLTSLIFSTNSLNWKKILFMPSIIAIAIGIIFIPINSIIEHYLLSFYNLSAFLMSLMGMGILGMWLSQSKITLNQLKDEFFYALLHIFCLFVIISIMVYVIYNIAYPQISNYIYALYFLALLPPAANIVVLETYYLKTGKSATSIACGTINSLMFIFIYMVVINSVFFKYFV
ncbi:hypothetical protein [Bartonella sp. DGB1]|uniref:hypothetical protein n=1 Tax=Bartonella sp. DGB1 TaxID=3239807 RepID=UPI003524168F